MIKKSYIKKYLCGLALTAAIMNTGNALAAQNPFSDVPEGHWARQAVTELAQKGIISGYEDGTFDGDKKITRFEMAQMVAKAMSREKELSAKDKAQLEKLEIEFADELDNLGVRVEKLEKKADNVKFSGQLAQKYNKGFMYGSRPDKKDDTWSEKYFELKAEAPIGNSGFTVHSQLETKWGGKYLNREDEQYTSELTQAWVEGNLGKTGQYIKAGQFSPWIQWGFVSGGSKIAGISLEHWDSKYTTHLFGGRVKETMYDMGSGGQMDWNEIETLPNGTETASTVSNPYNDFVRHHSTDKVIRNESTDWEFVDPTGKNDFGGSFKTDANGTQISHKTPSLYGFVYDYNFDDKLAASLGYYRFTSEAYEGEPLNIWAGMMNYKFAKNLTLQTIYSHGDQGGFDKAYNIELQYKGNPWIDVTKPHNFGAYIAYRYMGPDAIIKSNYDAAKGGTKGLEVGAFYTFTKNLQGTIKYFRGKSLITDHDRSRLYMTLEQYFQ